MSKEETASERRARLKEEWEADQKKGGAGDGNTDKLKDGKSTRRILPKADPEDAFYESYAMHYNLGPDGTESHLCIEPGGPFGGQSASDKKRDKKRNYRAKVCPSCKNFCNKKNKSRKFKFGSDEGKAYWANHVVQWRAKRQYVFGVTRPKSKNPRKVYVHRCGVMIGQPLLEAYYDQDGGGDFTDPKTGRNVVITKKTKGARGSNNVEYKVQITPDRTALEDWGKIKKKLPDLNSFIPEPLDPEAILALLEGDGDSADDDAPRSKKRRGGRENNGERDNDGDDDDGDEQALRVRKRKRSKDEEVDPDAPEESDDIDTELKTARLARKKAARKKKRKEQKSKMRARLERRANREKDL